MGGGISTGLNRMQVDVERLRERLGEMGTEDYGKRGQIMNFELLPVDRRHHC